MKNEPKVFEISDYLKNYNRLDYLNKFYALLKEKVLTEDPVQKTEEGLVQIIETRRFHSYGMELYNLNNSILVLEYSGMWTGYAHENKFPPELKDANISGLRLTIHNSNEELEKQIKETIKYFSKNYKK
ncbi:hypothetical protein HOK68_02940 [Candidatus Woesearchaeota archaeon]|jgi:hypothetical protein|nr:hypothetical protein [Candidatus Woesearchaeota archaeon]MBT4387881.1 hypothetical protein [Candidatus Woesearchaeota archaeon]MBT4595700.1 hypothetical protein [Candidatus Woesearchaeota archaeon]MBT5741451.1 hypothetical protein [Candidatus Woesearchaeota archaeon]MBT6505709.1 hypothetical protein [Candidatus Woesearchaeota archaeon]